MNMKLMQRAERQAPTVRIPGSLPSVDPAAHSPRPWRVSFSVSIALHLAVLMGAGRLPFTKPADFGIKGSAGSMEIYMVAALPAYAPSQPVAPKKIVVPEKNNGGMAVPALVKTEALKNKSARRGRRSSVKGDGSSPVPGQSATTFFSLASASVAPKAGRFENEAPVYPALAEERGQEGIVLLRVKVDKSGRPASVEIKKTSDFPLLDKAAVKAVRRWRFEPGRLGAMAIDAEINIPVRFQLENKSER